ncbi:DUF937 domain-containing protein [Nitrogeniibacter mangrovi]|uniref:DUF937 domain-containing protein n=1 Tax=Nitrogeniibacter mangrovi TaxID=2016596 RepID=A0A6C1B0Q2_9RHOO|nr:YidB family protein [Nitrogeniibacter mangrovi]QID17182.1 DUF937 domain-containing protein [Nitrogeniibacter mangrovi]
MGLFDQLAGEVAGQLLGGDGQGGTLVKLVMSLINQTEGGLPGLLSRLQSGGLASQVASWLGSGENAPVAGADIAHALGNDTIAQLARQFGLSGDQVAGGLAEALPGFIDRVSPQGEVSGDNALIEQGLSMLGGLLGNR